MTQQKTRAHGLYTEEGKRINEWNGAIVMDQHTGAPKLDPPLRLARGEKVYAWWNDELVAVFVDGGQLSPIEQMLTLPITFN